MERKSAPSTEDMQRLAALRLDREFQARLHQELTQDEDNSIDDYRENSIGQNINNDRKIDSDARYSRMRPSIVDFLS